MQSADVNVLKGAHVLLVEDNPVNRLVAEAMLAQWDVAVSVAVNGVEAIQAVEQASTAGERFDVVLMDLQMPVMGGLEATQAIRRRHDEASLPIIALTADVLVSERDKAMHHGMNDFLSKPIDVMRLASVLSHWVRQVRASR